ncbi:hypothetical protein PoB_003761700 [Plakobranchus ocellatus]|uniref:SMB domain-containing protein n=1 Tax=Plakobranchus ocellatus TaxID=259542 RepID=A0AAV4AVS7_9GAST|nr:hypothetical protein PoB_003761700 [Plakobranchus ocellatus]
MVVLPKCGTSPRPSDVFNESHGSENSDSDAVDTALTLRWNKTSPGFPENERNSQKAVDLSCSVSIEVASSKQNITIGMVTNNFQHNRKSLNHIENEHPCQESTFSSYGGIAPTNNSRSENGTDKNGTEISSAAHGYSLNNSRCENATDFYSNEPSLSLREYPQDNNNLNPGALPGMDDIDHSLIITCEGRCGEKLSFPCSCTTTCVVYGSCCDNITQDCPEVWQEGWARFEHITRADLVCHENLIYLISSCPRPVKEAVLGEGRWLANSKKPMLRKENMSSPSSSDVRASSNKDFIRIDSSSSAESDMDTQGSLYQRLKKALLLAPVTDSESGLTFSTRAIYDCNNMSGSTALPWALKLKYDFRSPTALEDFDQGETFNAFQPAFSKQILMNNLCVEQKVINRCKTTEGFEKFPADFADKCQKSNSLIYSIKVSHYVYRNIYCAYCNEGKHNSYIAVLTNKLDFKGPDLRVLMSLSDSKTFLFTLYTPSSFNPRFIKLPWSSATCPIPDDVSPATPGSIVDPASSESDGNSVCSVTCKNSRFTLRSDGMCKAKHEALLAVADDGHPRLCPSAITGLAHFILCGLENEIENLKNADLTLMGVTASASSQPSHTITCSMFPWYDRGDGHPSDTTLLNTLAPVLVAHGLLTHGTTKLPLPATKRTKN